MDIHGVPHVKGVAKQPATPVQVVRPDLVNQIADTTTPINQPLAPSRPNAERKVTAARASLMMKGGMPYLSTALMNMRPVYIDGREPRMAVDDKWRVYISIPWVCEMPVKEVAGALVHEVNHLLREHSDRGKNFGVHAQPVKQKMWNIACFPAGTLLPGNTPIEDIATMRRHYDGDLVCLRSQIGVIKATPEHPFWVRRRLGRTYPIRLSEPQWVEAADINERDYICSPRLGAGSTPAIQPLQAIDLTPYAISPHSFKSPHSQRTIAWTPEVAWMIGLWVAEGSHKSAGGMAGTQWSLGTHETDIIERLSKVLRNLGYAPRTDIDGSSTKVGCSSRLLAQWLADHCGTGARNKRVPLDILVCPDLSIRAAFLQGLLDGDGSTTTRRYAKAGTGHDWATVSSVSAGLIYDVALLLSQDGIGCHINTSNRPERIIAGQVLRPHTIHRVTWAPEGPVVSSKTMNGQAVTGSNVRWKSDDHGVWYPITKLSLEHFSGEVYNQSTESHTYIVNGVLVHNCDAEINDEIVELAATPEMKERIALSNCVLPDQLDMPPNQLAEVYWRKITENYCPDCGQPTGGQGQQGGQQGNSGQNQQGQGQQGGPQGNQQGNSGQNQQGQNQQGQQAGGQSGQGQQAGGQQGNSGQGQSGQAGGQSGQAGGSSGSGGQPGSSGGQSGGPERCPGCGKFVAQPDQGNGSGSGDGDGSGDGSGSGDSSGSGSSSGRGTGKGSGHDHGNLPEADCGSGADGKQRDWELPGDDPDHPGMDKAQADVVRHNTAVQIEQASQSRGDVPAGMTRWAKERLHPKVDWRKELGARVKQAVALAAGNQDYARGKAPRRRPAADGMVPYRLVSPVPRVVVVVDTSGSMSDTMLAQSLGEIDGILTKAMPGQHIDVIAVDAAATAAQKVQRWKDVKLLGGGGTDMGVGIKAAAAMRPKPDLVITLTDGYTPWPSTPPPGIRQLVGVIGAEDNNASVVQRVPDWAKAIAIPTED